MQEVKQWMYSYILCKCAAAVIWAELEIKLAFLCCTAQKKKKKNPKQKSQDA